jgi:hypothetical protein
VSQLNEGQVQGMLSPLSGESYSALLASLLAAGQISPFMFDSFMKKQPKEKEAKKR